MSFHYVYIKNTVTCTFMLTFMYVIRVHHGGTIRQQLLFTSCRNLASTFTLSLRLKTISVFSKTQKITKSRK